MQYGGGNCSLCGSPNTTKATCPLNPNAKNVNAIKHPNAFKSATSSKVADEPAKAKTPSPPKPKTATKTAKKTKYSRAAAIKRHKMAAAKKEADKSMKTAEKLDDKREKKTTKKRENKPTKTRKLRVVGRTATAKPAPASVETARPIKVVPGARPLSKDRKKLLNKNPPLKEAYIAVLDSYGIKFGTNPLGSGTFSDVYDLGNDTVLRIEPSNYFNRYAVSREKVNKYLIDNDRFTSTLYDVFPRIFSVDVKKSLMSPSAGWVIAVVMEKLHIDSWSNWRNYFATPEKLIEGAKEATEMMHKTGLIHTDISINNVVLTKTGRIVFIDVDDSCILPGCELGPGRTPGYEAPEWALSGYTSIKGKERTAMKETIAEWGIDPETLPKRTEFKKGKYDEPLKKNTIYGMGALLYHIFTGKDPANKIELKDVHPDIKNMLHPDMRKRTL